ncbi:MAG: hypothetical protein ACYC9S_06785 [Leptospirales bacterium]
MDLDTGSNLNSIVNYSIILSGLALLIFLVSISISRFVKHERYLQKKLPQDRPKLDPWGYPIEENPSSTTKDRLS